MLRVDAILKATEILNVAGSGIRWSNPTGEIYEITGDFTAAQIKEIEAKADTVLAEYTANQYQRDRAVSFPTWQEQMDMQYWDQVNGTTTWKDAVAKVKADNPKE